MTTINLNALLEEKNKEVAAAAERGDIWWEKAQKLLRASIATLDLVELGAMSAEDAALVLKNLYHNFGGRPAKDWESGRSSRETLPESSGSRS